MSQNPEKEYIIPKQQSIQDYIGQNLNLQTLKITKFAFNDLQKSQKLQKYSKSSLTSRKDKQKYFEKYQESSWYPKLSYRKLNNQPKMLISVQRKKLKSAQHSQKMKQLFAPPKSRNGFRGQKVKNPSYILLGTQERQPKAFTLTHKQKVERQNKKVPNLHFNYQYILKSRKNNDKKQKSVEQQTKTGSNKGFFIYFNSENFAKNIQKSSFRPNSHACDIRRKIQAQKHKYNISQQL